jgi:HTH-type transcriptional regulator/antitoxin HigA
MESAFGSTSTPQLSACRYASTASIIFGLFSGKVAPEGMIDAELQGDHAGTGDTVPEEERVANLAASDFCVARDKMNSFIARKNPFFYEKDVLAFAKINGVHPALPVGQIQHATGRFDYLKKYQVKIRQFVLPATIADGWGQSPAVAMEMR